MGVRWDGPVIRFMPIAVLLLSSLEGIFPYPQVFQRLHVNVSEFSECYISCFIILIPINPTGTSSLDLFDFSTTQQHNILFNLSLSSH